MGTPGFAVPVLEALLEGGHQVVGVVTQPDRPAGRGRARAASPVKRAAQDLDVPVLQPPSWRGEEAVGRVAAMAPEALVVAAYGRILPPALLRVPPLGTLNIHPSLLPRHRGPSPIAAALLAGEATTGVTVMLIDEGMDTGPILAQAEEPIRPEDTAETLTERLFHRGASLLSATLGPWARGDVPPQPQDDAQATYTRPLHREDGEMDFQHAAERLWRQVRAYTPWPGTHTTWAGRRLKLLDVVPVPAAGATAQPGEVVPLPPSAAALVGVTTGDGVLGLLRVQIEGRGPVAVRDFLAGHAAFVGARLPS